MTETTPWPQFTDFADMQGSSWLTDPKSKLNEFQKHSYVLDYFLPGKEPHMFLRAGANVKSSITLKEQRTYGPYDAGELITFPETQTGTFATSHWTTARAPLAWNKREVLLQAEGAWDEKSRAQTFHNVYFEKIANFMRSVGNAVDDEFFAYPTTAMESSTGNTPRSLWCFFNEARHTSDETLGAATDWNGVTTAVLANGMWPGFTSIAGIDPTDYFIGSSTTQSYWAVQQKTYTQLHNAATNGFRVLGGGDLVYQMDSMLLDLRWQSVPRAGEYSFTNGDCVIFTTRQGVQAIRQSLVSTSNDRWQGMAPTQTGTSMMYDGKQVVRMTGMETSYVYPSYDGTDEANAAGANTAAEMCTEGGYIAAGTIHADAHIGPRFMFVNTSDLVSFFHPEAFFSKTEPRQLFESRPDTYAMYLENWRNLHPKRLRSSGFLYPADTITGVSYTS